MRYSLFALLTLSFFCLISCGSGNSGSTSSAGPTSDFTISVSPASNIALWQGASTSVTVTVGENSHSFVAVDVSVSGLPAGVTVSPSPDTVLAEPVQNVTITFSTSTTTPVGPVTLTFTGSSGSLSHSVQATAQVGVLSQGAHAPFRTQYAFADLVFDQFTRPSMFYHQPTRRFFYLDQPQNRVLVFDATTESQIAAISVPGAWAIDQTSDGNTLYVGTDVGDIYTLDPLGMTVTGHVTSQQIGPSGYHAWKAFPLADGRLALLGDYTDDGSVYYYQSFAIWNPATNAFTEYAPVPGSTGATQVCAPMGSISNMVITPDRTQLLLGSGDSDLTVCRFNPSTAQYQTIAAPNGTNISIPADGQEFIRWQGSTPINIYDINSMQVRDHFAVSQLPGGPFSYMLSLDGNTLYEFDNGIGVAYNWRNHAQLGWFPVPQVGGGYYPSFGAIDETGLLAGALQQGVGFADASVLNSSAVPMEEDDRNIATQLNPDVSTVSGGVSVNINAGMPANITNVYFGADQLSGLSNLGTTLPSVAAPPHVAGPIDVTVQSSDGSLVSNYSGFSYGPYLTQSVAAYSTADGGLEPLVGYGLWSNPTDIVANNIQATANGNPVSPVAGGVLYSSPLQYVDVGLPSGTAGTSPDITVTNSAGTSVLHSAVTYLPATKQLTLPGATLQQGVYDPQRDVYYFTDVFEIRVFSKTQGAWLSSISIPPASGTQTLLALAISPDASKLAVTDPGANTIYLVNLNNTSQVSTFTAPVTVTNTGVGPLAVVVTNEGIVYYTTQYPNAPLPVLSSEFFRLDTSTGVSTPISSGQYFVRIPGGDPQQRLLLSADEQRIYYAIPGSDTEGMPARAAVYEPASDALYFQTFFDYLGDDEIALSSDQSTVAISEAVFDDALDLHAYLSDPTGIQSLNETFVPGEKLSADGSLLFEPLTDGILVNDTASGRLIARVALPLTLASSYDSLVSDGKDNVVVAITSSGVAVIDLSAITASAAQDSPLLPRFRESYPHVLNTAPATISATRAAAKVMPSLRHFAGVAVTPKSSAAITPAPRRTISVAAAQTETAMLTSAAVQKPQASSVATVSPNITSSRATMPRLLSMALSILPSTTASLEFDDVAMLRQSPRYAGFRQTYSSTFVQSAQSALSTLGIPEQSINQVVLTAGSNNFYGLISGPFSGAALLQVAPKNAVTSLSGQPVLCTASQVCITFIEDSVAAFGTLDQLRTIEQVRNGQSSSLSSNQAVTTLLNRADFTAAVIGVAPGSELNTWMGASPANALLNQYGVSTALSTVNSFGYSVALDTRAHVQMTLNMSSTLAANALSAMVNGVSSALSVGAQVSSVRSTFPISGLRATAINSQVKVSLSASIP